MPFPTCSLLNLATFFNLKSTSRMSFHLVLYMNMRELHRSFNNPRTREGHWGGIAIEGDANSQNLKEIMLTCAFCRINGGVQTEQELSNYSSVKNRILLI